MPSWKFIKREWWVMSCVALALAVLFVGVALMAAPPYFWRTAEAQVATTTIFMFTGGSVAEGAVGEFALTGDAFPNGLSGFTLKVEPADPLVAKVAGFDSPPYGIDRIDTFGATPGGMRLSVADLNNIVAPGASQVLLTTVRVQGLSAGSTTFTITVAKADDEIGSAIPALGIGATVTTTASRDLDGDGLTEDFNGNGRFDFDDIVQLFNLLLGAPNKEGGY